MKQIRATLLAGLLAALSVSLSAQAADILTTKDGFTVYTFDKDSAGKSVCNEACAATWPAVAPDMMKGKVETITRDDGSKQAALKGKALYRFSGDKAAGDKAGDGTGGVWHVVGTEAQPARTAPTSSY